MQYHKWLNNDNLKPQQALEILKEGNKRFINNLTTNRDNLQLIDANRNEQFPFAAILSCADSRVPTELIFDQSLGSIFSVRLAGNIASLKAIGSIEYACKYLSSKIIIVLGHTKCGGVIGACDKLSDGNIDAVLSDIQPAVQAETETVDNRDSSNIEFVNNVIKLNVEYQIQQITESSELIRKKISEGKISIIGGVYNIENGVVEFFD